MSDRLSRLSGPVIRYAVIPILLIADGLYALAWFVAHDNCSGTAWGYYCTAMCQQPAPIDAWVLLDGVGGSLLILALWLAGGRRWLITILRAAALFYLFAGRFWLLHTLASAPFTPCYP